MSLGNYAVAPIVAGLSTLVAVVVAAQALGWVARRFGQPTVLGEMVAGICLGPTLLGRVAPDVGGYLFGPSAQGLVSTLGTVGLALYMFHVGLEHRALPAPTGAAVLAVRIAALGIALPLTLGVLLAATVLAGLRPAAVDPTTYCLFVGGSLSITAFPMLTRVLQERRIIGTSLGIVSVRAAALDDVIAWCLLALVTARVAGNVEGALWGTLLPGALFAWACFTVLPRLLRRSVAEASRGEGLGAVAIAGLVVLVLSAATVTEWIGLYAVFGGFIVGASFPRHPPFVHAVEISLMPVVSALLLPMFFVSSGLVTDLGTLANLDMLRALGVLLTSAFVAKVAGAWLGSFGHGWAQRERLALGALLNARGLMILIFINVGLSLGVIDTPLFAMLTVVALVTTSLALPAYRWALGEEGEARLRRHGVSGIRARPRQQGGARG